MTRLLLLIALLAALPAQALRHELLDDFHDASAWRALASDQVGATLRRDHDGSLCLDYDFHGVSGYAVMRRALPMRWPGRFDLALKLKASAAVNTFQFKLVDASEQNVWWVNRPDAALPSALGDLKLRSRQIGFAWGPATDRRLRQTQFAEFVVVAGRDGGAGSLCLARLAMQEREAQPSSWPEPRMTASGRIIDIDLGASREFNGLTLRWPQGPSARRYELQAADDQGAWRTLRSVRGAGPLDALFLPDSEARRLRLRFESAATLPSLTLRSAADWPDRNAMLKTLAAELPRGDLPRAFLGQQNYWTLVGVDGGGGRSGLISEDGALELGRGGPSIEPAVRLEDGTLVTWAQVQIEQSLRDGDLPMPAVHWLHPALSLDIEAAADGPPDAPELLARYTLHNPTRRAQTYTLELALRPWQVNPPQQFLTTPGGVRELRQLSWSAAGLQIDGAAPMRFDVQPSTVTAAPFDAGLALAALAAAAPLRELQDPQAMASALLRFTFSVPAGQSRRLGWAAPLGAASPQAGSIDAHFDAAAQAWRARLGRVVVTLPQAGRAIAQTLHTTLAQILMSRDGPWLRPGTRSYARSWIRDGAMMVAGLVRLGEVDVARAFVDAFAERIFDSGKVPCCVDARGADPVVENDSHGEYLYAVAEVWRHTHDAAFLQRHWPRVQRVTAWIEALRQQERGDANRSPERSRLFGLMPPSISHEGYSDRPAYSYWDDFWALRGLKDAVLLARAAGDPVRAAQWTGWRDEFERELSASVVATARHYGIPFVAGAADRGDFDATSTTVAVSTTQLALPDGLLEASFERYAREARARADGSKPWHEYTPYELRTVSALTRLGQPGFAMQMLDFFLGHQRPAAWRQWAEVVLRDEREPWFLGDMPHAWVASDFIRSALDLLAFERESDGALVLAAGVPAAWLQQGPVGVQRLGTSWGPLSYRLMAVDGGWRCALSAPQPAAPGGLRLHWPGAGPLPRAMVGTVELAWQGRELPLPAQADNVMLWSR